MVWRVGNGESIDVWEDNWIPGNVSLRPRTPNFHNTSPLTVSVLLHTNMGWDMPIIDYLFWQEDIDEILKIRLGDRSSPNIQTWHH